MQNFTDIPSTRTLSDSLAEILNNDKTALSLSSGATFPTTNLQLGMPCYRSDQQKLYILTQVSPSAVWKLWMDFTGSDGKAPNAEAVDGVDSSTIVQNTRQITAGTGLSGGGDLSANRTLSLAAGAAAANLGYTPVNKAGDTMSGNFRVNTGSVARIAVSDTNSFDRGYLEWGGPAGGVTVMNTDNSHLQLGTSGVADRIKIDNGGRVALAYQPFAYVTYSGSALARGSKIPLIAGQTRPSGSYWDNSSYRFTCPIAGVYHASLGITGNTSQPSASMPNIRVNGVNVAFSYYPGGSVSISRFCNAGDYIEFYYDHDSAGYSGASTAQASVVLLG